MRRLQASKDTFHRSGHHFMVPTLNAEGLSNGRLTMPVLPYIQNLRMKNGLSLDIPLNRRVSIARSFTFLDGLRDRRTP